MLKKLLVMFVILMPFSAAIAQETESKAAKSEPQMESRMFQLKYKDPNEVAKAISPMSSDRPTARLIPNPSLKTLTIRDLPENLKALATAIDKLDVPEAAPAAFELQIYLIAASEEEAAGKTPMPKELDSVVSSLKSTLKYRNYRFINTSLSRVNDFGSAEFSGTIDLGGNSPQSAATVLTYRLQNLRLRTDSSQKDIVTVERFNYMLRVPIPTGANSFTYTDLGVGTSLNITPGGMTVVGTANSSSIGGALIVVISAKRVN